MTARLQRPDPDDSPNLALARVLKAIGEASGIRLFRDATTRAYLGDRQALTGFLDAMTPGQLADLATAARTLSTAADQALARKNP